ncbi:unnamed protein product, partial [Iphiclides podalirius]
MTSAIQSGCDRILPRPRGRETRNPWWTEELESMKKELIRKHHTIQKLKKKNLPMTEILEERNTLKKQYTEALSTTSSNHFKDFCTKQGKDDVWSLTNKLLKTKPLTQPPTNIKLKNGTYTENSKEAAQAILNDHFPDDTPDRTQEQHNARNITDKTPNTSSEPPYHN